MTPRASTLDTRALTYPIDRAAFQAWRSSASGPSGAGIMGTVFSVAVVLIIGFFALSSLSRGIPTLVRRSAHGVDGITLMVTILPGVLFLGAAVAVGTMLALRPIRARRRTFRLQRFAADNGMSLVGRVPAPAYPGMIFSVGGERVAQDVVRASRPRLVEFGNHRYTTGSGKSRRTHGWGYVRIRLDAPLPHIVLDALGNNSMFGSNLPASFSGGQRLSLEGDFDRHFALYCPEGYERDALYLFTPDVMSRFIDGAATFDVEIVDEWMFLYARRDVVGVDPEAWRRLIGTIEVVTEKLSQWARWRDERLPERASVASASDPLPTAAKGVAVEGRRLRRRFPWATVVFMVIFVAAWVFLQMR